MKEYTLKIENDDDPTNPRRWENLGIMVCFHRKYNLGDKHNLSSSNFDGWEELEQHLIEEENAINILPLSLYDHSGITMSIGELSGWDSGQVGFIYTTEERINSIGVEREGVDGILRGEVDIYDQYLRGEVYCFVIENDEDGIVDSCYGFFDEERAREEGESSLQYYESEEKKKRVAKLKILIKKRVPLQKREELLYG